MPFPRVFIIKGFQTIVFIFIVISTTFQSICPPAFFRCLLNLGTYSELWTMSFIESMGVACSDSITLCSNRTHSITVIGIGSLIIWRLRVQSWLQANNNTGILNTCTQLWLTEHVPLETRCLIYCTRMESINIHIMTSYLLLMTFLTNRIQILQQRWQKCVDCKGDYVENKPHLVTFHESILVSLWTFQLTLVHECVIYGLRLSS